MRLAASLQIVLLPTPDGPLTITTLPFVLFDLSMFFVTEPPVKLGAKNKLLHVLDLLFNPVYLALDIKHVTNNLAIRALAGNRVGFPEHLLADEI